MPRTITSANAQLTISAPDVFSTPQSIQGFAVDDAFSTEAVDASEAIMGVDGIMSAGFTPFITKQTIHIQADSPSLDVFQTILGAMESAQDMFFLDATIVYPSINKIFTFTKGALTKAKQFPDAKKILQPTEFEISWESVTFAPLN